MKLSLVGCGASVFPKSHAVQFGLCSELTKLLGSLKLIVEIALLLSFSGFVLAQDAGAFRQQIEGSRAFELPKRMLPFGEPAATVSPLSATEEVKIQIKRIRFSGNTLLDEQDFKQLVSRYARQAWSLRELREELPLQIAELYRSRGWVVSVTLQEPIDSAEGEVIFKIIEARIGRIVFEGETPQQVHKSLILELFQHQLLGQEHLNNMDVNRAVLLSNALPGVFVAARQKAGQTVGETDVLVSAKDASRFGGGVTFDNTGARSIGADRMLGNVEWRSPMGLADALALSMMHTQGSEYLRLSYNFPIAHNGLRVGVNSSRFDYKVVSPELKVLGGEGNSSSSGFEFNYPLIRAYDRNLFLVGNLDHKSYGNRTLIAGTTSQYEVHTFAPSLTGNSFDNFAGGGSNAFSLTLTRGQVNLDGSPNQASDLATAHTQGMFTKLILSLSRQQNITKVISASVSYSEQISDKNLDSSERFYLGGISGVRAYPLNEANGSEGQLFNLEFKLQLVDGYEVAAFFDKGHVELYRNNEFTGAPANNSQLIQGHGLSLSWRSSDGLNVKATWARRNGVNPNPTATGQDQDGSLKVNRLWLSAGYVF